MFTSPPSTQHQAVLARTQRNADLAPPPGLYASVPNNPFDGAKKTLDVKMPAGKEDADEGTAIVSPSALSEQRSALITQTTSA